MADVVLITGVSRHLGGAFARRLSTDESVGRIIGVDVVPPPHSIGRAEFVRADIRSPMIGRIMDAAGVDTVVHMSVIATQAGGASRTAQKEINVIGTMQLLAACQKSTTLRHIVVKSTAGVYGSSPKDPAMFTEDMSARRLPTSGFGKDSVEVEGYVRGFSRRRPDLGVSILRFANVIGPEIRTAFTDYYSLPVVPIPFGYDARLQFVHEKDCVGALHRAARVSEGVGVVNVAGDGVITVSQAAALAGRAHVRVPPQSSALISQMLARAGVIGYTSDQIKLLTFGRGIETTRMRTVLGYEPEFTTRGAFLDFARHIPVPVWRSASSAAGSAALGAAGSALHAVTELLPSRSED
ncbi:NAD-dependent epimerase/dehydratase family protein [Janibacter sp. G56]|uniref:NAD-dependent epimerase/dehydratase family protein n=1 Tax=Janibacter sp. G56 TaxID=3418717 RepID=UPI003D00A0B8